MEPLEEDNHRLLIFDLVATSQGLVTLCRQGESRSSGMESESFAQAGFKVRKFGHVLNIDSVFANDLVDFRLQFEVCFRIGKEFVEEE